MLYYVKNRLKIIKILKIFIFFKYNLSYYKYLIYNIKLK